MDGSYHEVDSSEMAFKIAGFAWLSKLGVRKKGKPIIMEPVFKMEVLTPDEYMGDVIGDLKCSPRLYRRCGGIEVGLQAVRGFAPLKQMFGYATDLAL